MHACTGNCEKLMEQSDGIDINHKATATTKQVARADRKKEAKKRKLEVLGVGERIRPPSGRISQASSQSDRANPEELDRLIGEKTTSSSGSSGGSTYEE